MRFSIVIPTLNEEKYIGKTLESIKAQKTSNKIEVIVGDGYSTDKTEKIAKSFGAKVVKEKRHSAAWERAAGANVAKGDIVAFTDADALLPQNWVETVGKIFESDKKIVLVYGPVYFSDTSSFEKALSKVVMKTYLTICAMIGVDNPIGSNIALRRSAYEKVGGFDTSLVTAEDIDLSKRLAKLGKIKFSPQVYANVSARRVKKWGYLYFVLYHIFNAVKFQLTGRANKNYAPVR